MVGGDRPLAPMAAVRRQAHIPAELERLAEIRALVREVCAECDVPGDCRGDIVQAVDEAASNIIRHGYRGRPGFIDLTAELVGDDIVVTLEDTAPTFDPTTIPAADTSIHPSQRAPGGMGMHLIRLEVDRVEHRPRPGGGNILTLTRSRVPRSKEG